VASKYSSVRKYNKSGHIKDFIQRNPNIAPVIVAQKFGIKVSSVYKYRSAVNKEKPILHLVPNMEAKEDGGTQVIETEAVNHPPHYTDGGIETIEFIRAKLTPEEFRGYCVGNALKYLSRAGKKGDASEDRRKAVWYLSYLEDHTA